jgi:hypothetical protein
MRQQWRFTGNVVQRIVLIFEHSGPNVLNTTINITCKPRGFIWEGVAQKDRLLRQRQRRDICRTECRIQGHVVGLLTAKCKKIKNSEEVVNLVSFISMNITSLKLKRLIEASGPLIKASCS